MNRIASSPLWPGVPLALAAALLFGATAPLSKQLLGSVDPQLLAGLLYLGAGLGLAGIRFVRNAVGLPSPETPLRRADMPWLAAVIVFGGILGPLLLMLGLQRTDAASGSLLLNLEGLATMAIAWLVFRENVDRRLLIGAFAILLGAVVLSWQGQTWQGQTWQGQTWQGQTWQGQLWNAQQVSLDAGAAFIAAACLAWGIDNNLTRKLSSSDPVEIAFAKGLAAGVVNIAIAFTRGAQMPPASMAGAAAIVGFLGVGVSLVLFVLALRHLGAARTGAYFSLAPFVGAVVAIGFLHEPATLKLLLAGLLMALGLWLHLAERHNHEHRHGAIDHEHAHVHDEHHTHVHAGPVSEPHSHPHRHEPLTHAHVHYPDQHHRHDH
ncbi:EamA family transporter [Roseiarcaceae bacterium H3SJ34-1]|uniref:DMT family transporter n=1 Tax=Terripilifer ovatus TaxID=3032367 RepID=UPI003AB9A1D4|nr:EamA family transporter [Roseiarcaceae bacterium H3SJ34-1]